MAGPQHEHDPADLIRLFDATFADENTVLIRGDDEPVYLPADAHCPRHRVVFAHGFYASALHEIAHWCIAGRQRRQLLDYGYWYEPDGRDAEQQAAFERVEVRPQAVEWGLCLAAGFRFQVSVDNLSGLAVDREGFQRRVYEELRRCWSGAFPPRARRFMDVLQGFYRTAPRLPSPP